jgi:hypothetical protein
MCQALKSGKRKYAAKDKKPFVAEPVHNRSKKDSSKEYPNGHGGRKTVGSFHKLIQLPQERSQGKHGYTEEEHTGTGGNEHCRNRIPLG